MGPALIVSSRWQKVSTVSSVTSSSTRGAGLTCWTWSPVQTLHLKFGSSTRRVLIPLHLLCTHSSHELHLMEFLRTPLWHTAQGYLPCFLTGAELLLLTITLVLPMFTLSPLLSMPSFHSLSLTISSSMVLAMITRSSAYSSSHGHPVLNSMERASSTMMNSRGLNTEPWCTPILTSKGSLNAVPTLTLALALWYIACTVLISTSGTPSLRMAHQSTARGTLSKAFSRSTKARYKVLSLASFVKRKKSKNVGFFFPYIFRQTT